MQHGRPRMALRLKPRRRKHLGTPISRLAIATQSNPGPEVPVILAKAGIQRLRVAPSLFGGPAVTRGLREEPDRSTDLLLCVRGSELGWDRIQPIPAVRNAPYHLRAHPPTDRYATRWVPAFARMTEFASTERSTNGTELGPDPLRPIWTRTALGKRRARPRAGFPPLRE